eukprot:2954850-Rhodomonas_salina.3
MTVRAVLSLGYDARAHAVLKSCYRRPKVLVDVVLSLGCRWAVVLQRVRSCGTKRVLSVDYGATETGLRSYLRLAALPRFNMQSKTDSHKLNTRRVQSCLVLLVSFNVRCSVGMWTKP